MITIAFDVNGTLTQERVRALFNALNRRKCRVIVWSTLGINYCKQFCLKHELKPDEFWEKHTRHVDIAVDDQLVSILQADVVVEV